MNQISNYLEQFVKTFQSDPTVAENNVLDKLKTACENSPIVTVVKEVKSNLVYYINPAAAAFFELDAREVERDGLLFSQKLLHPDSHHLKAAAISFFDNPENYHQMYEYIYFVKTAEEWKWVYSCNRIIAFHADGTPMYIMGLICDIHAILNEETVADGHMTDLAGLNNLQIERYNSLSNREKEILLLISKEFTTLEIAKKLFISKATVDSHRKNLLKKLNVKNAIGLAKYAMLFDPAYE